MAERSLALANAMMALRWRMFLPRQLPATCPNFSLNCPLDSSIKESTLDEPDQDRSLLPRDYLALCYKGQLI